MADPKPKKTETRKVEVFRPGTFRAMNGQDYEFTESDVAEMAASYDRETAPAPVVVGHPKHDDPAFGWAVGFEVNDAGILVAEVGDLAPAFVAAVEDGRYRKVSMKFFTPDAAGNPKPGTYYPRHIGFLGGAAPAVSGLMPVQFSDADDTDVVEITFSLEEATRNTASVMRSLREFLIEKFGLESANQAIPEYHIRWIEDAGEEPETAPGFTAPHQNSDTQTTKEPPMSGDDDKLAARTAEIEKRERALVHNENLAFADGLLEEGKLLPAQKAATVALLDELSVGDPADIAFSVDGEEKKLAPADLLKGVLSAAGKVIEFGTLDLGDPPSDATSAAFAADGMDVDAAQFALHQKAKAYQTQNPGTEYLDAVAAVKEG
jgi:hypothetical protein